jgi:hypothetical protein
MRFLMMHRIDETAPNAYSPSPEVIAGMGSLIEEMTKAGVLLAAEGASHSADGARVKLSDGKRTVIDGPFTEAKEVIGGYAVLQVRSKDEAIEWASRFADVLGDTEVEIRRLSDMGA